MIVCFYGHKGGAGRSAAVANVAPALSSAGYRVLIVDFDLEAPGVHRFFGIPDAACAGGVVDLVEDHAARLAAGGDVELPPFPEALLLEPRFETVKTPESELSAEAVRDQILGPRTIGTTTPFETGVRILPAGRLDDRYRERVAAIDWSARWQDPAWRVFFGWLKLELEARAEVVFLDARAGVTELAALCLFALADRVVMLTPPTSQGLDGALATGRALRKAGRGPGDHGTLLVPSRVSKDADREHLGRWLHTARKAVSDPELLPLWAETRGRSQQDRAAEEMLERYLLPELAVHAVGEPLVALRMLERGISQDDLQDRYAVLAGTIQRWAADGRREAAALERLEEAGEVLDRIENARVERRLDELPGLYGRLAEVKLGAMTQWAHAQEAAELARQGAAAAALFGDEAAELRLLVLQGKALLKAEDPEAAELVLRPAALRLAGRLDHTLLSLEARGRLGFALSRQEKDEEAVPMLRGVWEEADALGMAEVLEWRVNARKEAAYELADLGVLREAWEIAQGGPRELVVYAGTALAQHLGGEEGLEIADHCRVRARESPRQPELVGCAEFAWVCCFDDDAVSDWTNVIHTLKECSPETVDLPIAYSNRARCRESARLRMEDFALEAASWRALPRLYPRAYSHGARFRIHALADGADRLPSLVNELSVLRGFVEEGRSRRTGTQALAMEAHFAFNRRAASPPIALEAALALDASLRSRPWSAGRGGWRPGFVALAPLVLAVAARDADDDQLRVSQVRSAFAAAAPHAEAASLVHWIRAVYLTEADRRTLLGEALVLSSACPEFKAAIQSNLDGLTTQ